MPTAGQVISTSKIHRSDEEAAEIARAHFPRYAALLSHWDRKLQKWLYHEFGMRYQKGDFLGFLYERYVIAWRYYDPDKCAFTTYFWGARHHKALFLYFLRYESESWGRFSRDRAVSQVEFDEQTAHYAHHEYWLRLSRAHEPDDGWLDDLFERFGSQQETWDWLNRQLSEREQFIISRRLAGQLLETIGRDIGVSRERVGQIQTRAHEKIGNALRKDKRSSNLFLPEEEATR